MSALRGLAGADGHADIATAVFDRIPRHATSISDLIAPVFGRAMAARTRWDARQFLGYMDRPSFEEAAERVVFSQHSATGQLLDTFRPSDGDLLTLQDGITLDVDQAVQVARPQNFGPEVRKGWHEHLANFEVVQPFPQFDRA